MDICHAGRPFFASGSIGYLSRFLLVQPAGGHPVNIPEGLLKVAVSMIADSPGNLTDRQSVLPQQLGGLFHADMLDAGINRHAVELLKAGH